MVTYTDQQIRDKGILYLPKQEYLQDPYQFSVAPVPPPASGGITNTNAFNNNSNDNFNPAGNNFQNNTNVLGLRTPGSDFASSGSYVTNRTNSGRMIPGTKEEEDNFLQKILKAGGRGIAAMIPGAGMLTSVANKFDRFKDLNPLDQEFIQSQMSGYEQNIHGTQNLPYQDRYGYNKRSAFGNYSELIDKRVDIAEKFFKKNDYYRPIDEYYLDKAKDKNTIQSQMDMNDIVRNRAISNKLRSGDPKNNPSSKDYQPVGPNSPPTPSNNDNRNDTSNDTNPNPSTPGAQDSFSNKSGKGRTGYFFGGRVNYKAGGRTDAGPNRTTASHSTRGQINESGQQVSGGQTTRDNNNNGGASDNPPVTVVNNNPIDISTVTKSVGDYDIPYGLEALMADKGRLKAVLNADNILDKNIGAEFTYDQGPYQVGFNADMEGNKSLNANYTRNNSNYSFDLNDGGGQLKFTRTFANGGLAGLL